MSAGGDIKAAPVFFILGGPGSGKGTNCARLVADFGLIHISAGDLLRDEAKKDTPRAAKVSEILKNGQIVPSEITVELLFDALRNAAAASQLPLRGFLVDGFPRKMDQALMFEEQWARAHGILYFECTMAVMEQRILGRAASGSTRADDNIETLRRRFQSNVEQCVPVVEKYKSEGRCTVVDSCRQVDEVYNDVKKLFLETYRMTPIAPPASA